MKKLAMLTMLAGATGLVMFPVMAQPDLNRGGVAGEKAGKGKQKEDEARKIVEKAFEKAAANDLGARMVFLKGAGEMSPERVRASLQAQGVTDENTQNAILEHVARTETARKSVDEKAAALRDNLKPNAVVADVQFNVLFNDYQAAIEDYRALRDKSAHQLDEKIGYTKNTRLHATLLLLGIIGDAPAAGNSNWGMNGITTLTRRLGEPPMIMRWNGAPDGNGQFNFDFNGGLPQNGAAPFNAPDANVIIEKALRAVPNPFFQANPVLDPDQIGALRREFGAQIKELREELNRLKAGQGEKEKAPTEKGAKKERVEKGEQF